MIGDTANGTGRPESSDDRGLQCGVPQPCGIGAREPRPATAGRHPGDQRQLEPDGVEGKLAEREVLKPGLFRAADQVLGVAAAALQPLDLDRIAGEVSERRLEAVR